MNKIRKYIDIINEANFNGEPSEDALLCIFQLIHQAEPARGSSERKKFDAVLDKEMPLLDIWGTTNVYRGVALDSWDELHPNFNFFDRDILKAFDYLHTSTSEKIAESFMEGWENLSAFVKFDIAIDEKTKGVDVQEFQFEYGLKAAEAAAKAYGKDSEYYDPLYGISESEVILNRKAEFKVISKEQQEECPWSPDPEADYWIVELEQIK